MTKSFKKLLSTILISIMILCIVPMAASAESYSGECGDNVTWSLDTETGVLKIEGSGSMKNYYSNYAPWKKYYSNITTVEIYNGVTSIGDAAFATCESLTSINIPDSVTRIGIFAFQGCSSLTSINIPDSVTGIESFTFLGCESLTSINIPDGMTGILEYAFAGCSSLTSINIPNSVIGILDYAFYGCSSLTDVYYSGNEADWKDIIIGSNNECLTNATIHYGRVNGQKCDCMCHKSGFSGFIWKLVKIFYQIFRINKTCDCGVAHY